jgi:hypothetical protein
MANAARASDWSRACYGCPDFVESLGAIFDGICNESPVDGFADGLGELLGAIFDGIPDESLVDGFVDGLGELLGVIFVGMAVESLARRNVSPFAVTGWPWVGVSFLTRWPMVDVPDASFIPDCVWFFVLSPLTSPLLVERRWWWCRLWPVLSDMRPVLSLEVV